LYVLPYNISIKKFEFFKLENGKEPVWEWIYKLDKSAQVRVLDRFTRIAEGNYGDKSTQTKDIKKAEEYFKIWKEQNNE
jgi:putative component of toxin-antitoxin plasmid stabilization module